MNRWKTWLFLAAVLAITVIIWAGTVVVTAMCADSGGHTEPVYGRGGWICAKDQP